MLAEATRLLRTPIIAIARLERYDQAPALAEALLAGGISAIEFTLTGAGAIEAIAEVRQTLGDAVEVGAGTVLTAEAAGAAIAAGAHFVVTPVVRPAVVAVCRAAGVLSICGALTPSEVLAAHEAGAALIKVFPARAMGGPRYISDLLAPLPGLRLVATGGVDATNACAYLDAGAAAVGIGGNLVAPELVAGGRWRQITEAARACVAAIAPPGSVENRARAAGPPSGAAARSLP